MWLDLTVTGTEISVNWKVMNKLILICYLTVANTNRKMTN